MDNMDDSENNVKISDSAYSNSCSNSQSRRSSKSTHSGSNSSGSSGYGGKQSTSDYSINNPNKSPEKRLKQKDSKKNKQVQSEILIEAENEIEDGLPEPVPIFESPREDTNNDVPMSSPAHTSPEKGSENMDIATSDTTSNKGDVEFMDIAAETSVKKTLDCTTNRSKLQIRLGFACVISLHDGVVLYTNSSLTSTLGFPKDMWIGRSFIDFVHPMDRNAFISHITNGLAVPKNADGTLGKADRENSVSSMVCRIRRYKNLTSGFGVRSDVVSYMPLLLKLSFKNVNNKDGGEMYLIMHATPFFSAFKTPNEIVTKPVLFIIRHASNGNLDYVAPESVPYLGYLPQEVTNKDALHLYHPHDLVYLKQIYETIVKEGGSPRSKSYRMLAQNGDYVRLETEWSSFINPWSKKVEFVIGKHYVVEGPTNPDVFQPPDANKTLKLSEEDMSKAQNLRESIIKILNEVLTKPAEVEKQQMNKRCTDVAKFMENLIENHPKHGDETRLEVQDTDQSCNDRDWVMLGGISPHHDSDSKSSTGTPVSYYQLNYKDTLQRYFQSYPYCSYEEYNIVTSENVLGIEDTKATTKDSMSPIADTAKTGDCNPKPTPMEGVKSVALSRDYHPVRLTETVLSKHNEKMVKELVKIHRENRSTSKGEKEKNSNDSFQKKKEHLARCNASFQPTTAGMNMTTTQPQGVKRDSKHIESESGSNKYRCNSPRQRRKQPTSTATQHATSTPATNTVASTPWPSNPMSTYILGVGIPQQMSIVNPVAAMPAGMYPIQYMQGPGPQMPASTPANNTLAENSSGMYQEPTMQCMMYGQAVYGSPFMYTPINPQVSYPIPQNYVTSEGMQYVNNTNVLSLSESNYAEACKTNLNKKTEKLRFGKASKAKKRALTKALIQESLMSNSSENTSNMESGILGSDKGGTGKSQKNPSDLSFFRTSCSIKSTKAVRETTQTEAAQGTKPANSEEAIDRTDGESSYSSLYSSFFKTESGSAEDSSEHKKLFGKDNKTFDSKSGYSKIGRAHVMTGPKRKREPPWLEHVCVTSELIYKYQIQTKNMEEVLLSDKQKLKKLEQPSLVNEQLGQLYLDLQLEGVAARLTLEEGATSSSCSTEELSITPPKTSKKKREYSKLVMIYEENAPLPPPDSPSSASVS